MTHFKKMATGALAALTLGGAIAATATPAAAQRYHGGRYNRGSNVGGAVVAGLAGLAIGTAISGGNRGYYGGGGYYAGGYGGGYGRPYYGGYGYAPQAYYGGGYGYGPRCRVTTRYDGWGRPYPVERCW